MNKFDNDVLSEVSEDDLETILASIRNDAPPEMPERILNGMDDVMRKAHTDGVTWKEAETRMMDYLTAEKLKIN